MQWKLLKNNQKLTKLNSPAESQDVLNITQDQNRFACVVVFLHATPILYLSAARVFTQSSHLPHLTLPYQRASNLTTADQRDVMIV